MGDRGGGDGGTVATGGSGGIGDSSGAAGGAAGGGAGTGRTGGAGRDHARMGDRNIERKGDRDLGDRAGCRGLGGRLDCGGRFDGVGGGAGRGKLGISNMRGASGDGVMSRLISKLMEESGEGDRSCTITVMRVQWRPDNLKT